MISIFVLILLGGVLGANYDIRAIGLASIAILATWLVNLAIGPPLSVVSVLMLIAYLSAVQGGYLIGAWTRP
ncbi:hypothetical protein EEDFHM_04087 [Methylorubrum populi]